MLVDPNQLQNELGRRKPVASSAVVASHWVLREQRTAQAVFLMGAGRCEETDQAGHGYAFLTRPTDDRRAHRRVDSWGRFRREAIVHDPQTGVVYMTEDHGKSCFYRLSLMIPLSRQGAAGYRR